MTARVDISSISRQTLEAQDLCTVIHVRADPKGRTAGGGNP